MNDNNNFDNRKRVGATSPHHPYVDRNLTDKKKAKKPAADEYTAYEEVKGGAIPADATPPKTEPAKFDPGGTA